MHSESPPTPEELFDFYMRSKDVKSAIQQIDIQASEPWMDDLSATIWRMINRAVDEEVSAVFEQDDTKRQYEDVEHDIEQDKGDNGSLNEMKWETLKLRKSFALSFFTTLGVASVGLLLRKAGRKRFRRKCIKDNE